jgi:hypothetical protein
MAQAPSAPDAPTPEDARPPAEAPPAPGGTRDVPAPAPEDAAPRLRPGSTTAQPLPHTPTDGAEVETASVPFEWTPVAGATNYELEIAADPDFEEVLFDGRVGEDTHFTFSGLPPHEGLTIYWRVRAEVDGTWGAYGPAGHFALHDWRAEPVFDDDAEPDGVQPVTTEDSASRIVAVFMILTIAVSVGTLAALFLSLQDWEGGLIPTADSAVEEVQGYDPDASGVPPSDYEELEDGRWQIPIERAIELEATDENAGAMAPEAAAEAQDPISNADPAGENRP